MRSLIIFCTLFIVIGVSIAHYADRVLVNPVSKSNNPIPVVTRPSPPPMAVVMAPQPPAPPSSKNAPSPKTAAPVKPPLPEIIKLPSSQSVTLSGDRDGHFRVDARVDTLRVGFIVDTGAGTVALRESTAAQLGIHLADRDYTVRTQTANGVGRAAPIRLGVIEIDNIIVRDVRAIVLSDEALQENLLGMSFLSRVRWTHDRGKLVIEQ